MRSGVGDFLTLEFRVEHTFDGPVDLGAGLNTGHLARCRQHWIAAERIEIGRAARCHGPGRALRLRLVAGARCRIAAGHQQLDEAATERAWLIASGLTPHGAGMRWAGMRWAGMRRAGMCCAGMRHALHLAGQCRFALLGGDVKCLRQSLRGQDNHRRRTDRQHGNKHRDATHD